MMKVSVSPKAYAKVLLHACKYPHKAINGIFLAEECKHSSDLLRIVDAIPLFHQCLGLAAMLEIALSQVSAFQFSYSCIDGILWSNYRIPPTKLNTHGVTCIKKG